MPGAINYQGRLLNSGGQPVTTPVDVTFSLWDNATTGTQLGGAWSDTDTVTPDANGVYSTTIGDDPGNPLLPSIFNAVEVWLNVNVEGEDLTPRARLLTVPYAASASILSGEAFLMVPTTADPATNGANLLATYAAAKALTPHGHALTSTNRATVIVPPGFYQLDTAPLTLDTEYVDVVGLTTSRNEQFLFGDGVFDGSTTCVIRQTANNVRIENLVVKCTLSSGSAPQNSSAPAAYFPNTNLSNTVIRNCEFTSNEPSAWSMRLGIAYSGAYEGCSAGAYSFGSAVGSASGTFINCTGADYAFGSAFATASGTFTNCTGGDYSFGGAASNAHGGEFYHCVGGIGAFTETGAPIPVHIACTQNGAPYSGNDDDSDAANELNTQFELTDTLLTLTDAGGSYYAELGGLIGLQAGEAYLTVQTTANPVTNGFNLLAAYNDAAVSTPHGAALSATNRATVLVPPGRYDLGADCLWLGTEYVDVVGMSTARDDQYIFGIGAANGFTTGVLRQTASDVRIENLVVECTRASGGLSWKTTDPAAYFPNTDLANTVIRNCEFKADDTNALSMRYGIEFSGAFEDCTGGVDAFGAEGTASGTFTDCTGGDYAFAGYGTASGTFTNCTSGIYSFGASDTASGTFINCIGGGDSFGGNGGTASGIFTNCTSDINSFGGSGTASGTFTDCTGGYQAFGGGFSGTASGTFTKCTGDQYAFGGLGGTASGTFSDCIATTGSFGGRAGATTGGEFYSCRMTGDWDDGFATTFNGKMQDCQWADSIVLGVSAEVSHTVFNGYTMNGATHVSVNVTNNATTNGLNLIAAYAAAKALTPHGSALSATNRTTVLVPPGHYYLGTAPLTLDAEHVDLVGLSTARDDQYIYGLSGGVGTGVLQQTASDVRIENLVVECTRASGGIIGLGATTPAAYFPNTNLSNTVVRNCEFRADDTNALSMRYEIDYPGAFEDCTGGDSAFGGSGTASGTFTNCTSGGQYAFGGYGTASGTFTNCTSGGESGFGGYGTASGTFTDCTGGSYSFGGNGTASGEFADCTGGNFAFGASDTADGTFINCTGGNWSFGGWGGTASGTFSDCTATTGSFGGRTGTSTGGEFFNCRLTGDWDDGFATTFNGKMQDCHWADGITCGAAARIYNSIFLGDVDLNSTAAGIASSFVNDSINNAGSAVFNTNNLESADIN